MLKIETINDLMSIEMDGSAPSLILEWMNLTQQLSTKLSEETGHDVDINLMIKTGMQLLQEKDQ